MSLILRLVHELQLLATTFLLPLYIITLMVSCGVGGATSLAFNMMVLLFLWCCYHRPYTDFHMRRKSVKSIYQPQLNIIPNFICNFVASRPFKFILL